MSNLLPEVGQQRIRSEYRARFVLAGALLSMIAALFTVLALSPSYGVLLTTRPQVLAQASQAQEEKTDSDDIAQAQMLLVQIGTLAVATSSASGAIIEALEPRPNGARIDTIAYVAGESATISLSGVAESRNVMDTYRMSLQENLRFASVKLPVGDLVGAKGGRFTITLTGEF